MQRACEYLKAESTDGCITLTSLPLGLNFYLLGASCPTSALPGCDKLSRLVVTPRSDSPQELVAVAVFFPLRGTIQYAEYLLSVTPSEEPWIDLEKPFRPSRDRIGQLIGEGQAAFLVADVGGKKVAYQPYAFAHDTVKLLTDKGYAVLGAGGGNLLCRYLLDEATPEEVEAAIIASPDGSSELETLRREVKSYQDLVALKDQTICNLRDNEKQLYKRHELTSLAAQILCGKDVPRQTWFNQSSGAKYRRLLKLFGSFSGK